MWLSRLVCRSDDAWIPPPPGHAAVWCYLQQNGRCSALSIAEPISNRLGRDDSNWLALFSAALIRSNCSAVPHHNGSRNADRGHVRGDGDTVWRIS